MESRDLDDHEDKRRRLDAERDKVGLEGLNGEPAQRRLNDLVVPGVGAVEARRDEQVVRHAGTARWTSEHSSLIRRSRAHVMRMSARTKRSVTGSGSAGKRREAYL